MADTIRILRSDTTATPPTLAVGELAYSELSGNLYYGRIADGAPVIIGGKALKDKLDNLTASDISDFAAAVELIIADAVLSDLADVSGTPSSGQVLTWNGTSWVPMAVPGGVDTFIALNDTPSSFTGAAGRFVKVNSAGTGLEFVDGIDGGTF